MTAMTPGELVEDLERELVGAGAAILGSRADADSGFVSAQCGDRSMSCDIFWDDRRRLVANICAGANDRIEPNDDQLEIENPGTGLAGEVLDLLIKEEL